MKPRHSTGNITQNRLETPVNHSNHALHGSAHVYDANAKPIAEALNFLAHENIYRVYRGLSGLQGIEGDFRKNSPWYAVGNKIFHFFETKPWLITCEI